MKPFDIKKFLTENKLTKLTSEVDTPTNEEEVEEIQIPKTKAATINAAVEMLKKARKHEAQAMFKKMVGIKEGAEESDEVVTEESTPAKEVEFDVDYKEDLDALVSEEATLSDGFRDKAGIIFETALKAKVGDAVEKIEAEMAQNLEEEVTEIQATIVEKVDSYLNYVVETWMKDNVTFTYSGNNGTGAMDLGSLASGALAQVTVDVLVGYGSKVDMSIYVFIKSTSKKCLETSRCIPL